MDSNCSTDLLCSSELRCFTELHCFTELQCSSELHCSIGKSQGMQCLLIFFTVIFVPLLFTLSHKVTVNNWHRFLFLLPGRLSTLLLTCYCVFCHIIGELSRRLVVSIDERIDKETDRIHYSTLFFVDVVVLFVNSRELLVRLITVSGCAWMEKR